LNATRRALPSAGDAAAAAAPVLALLDDATAAPLVEWSAALARALQRELALVYVESTRSLVAAALPLTSVLAPGGRQWQPLSPPDVEQGFRAQAARLRELAARVAGREALHWSLRTVRGELAEAAQRLGPEADLLLLPPPLALGPGLPVPASHRPMLLVLADDGAPPSRALQVARLLAQALRGSVEVAPTDHERLVAARADLVVLSRLPDEPRLLGLLRCPLLRVG
jgi:hypothetical protein